jgi:UDP-N-acetylglucosamine acyltransferase
VSQKTELGDGNAIGPFVIVEDNVVLGNNNRIDGHSVIKSGSRIGNDNRFHEHVVFGGAPQDASFDESADTFAVLGDGNVLREYFTAHRATTKEEGYTTIGNHNYFMASTHVAHDCHLGDHITFATQAAIGGHVHIDDRAFVSGGVMVHQFAKIGAYAMLGGNSKITQDCLPFMITDGVPGRVRGLNLVGLKRAGYARDDIRALKEAYRILFGARRPLEDILTELEQHPSSHVQHLAEFIRNSKRNFHRAG